MTASVPQPDDHLLAIIESLRAYVSARRYDGRPAEQLAEEWRASQLFPPTPEDLGRALALMRKTVMGTTRV